MLLEALEGWFIYHPDRNFRSDLISAFDLEEVELGDQPEERIHAVYKEHPGEKVVLFSHGNGGNLFGLPEMAAFFDCLGISYLLYDYPGYGQSSGRPDEQSLYRAHREAWRFLVEERQYPPQQVILFGQSLGGAVAVEGGLHCPAGGIIVESSFTSTHAMARHMFGRFPVQWFFKNKFTSVDKVAHLKMPLLLIHGRSDETVPVEHSEQLFASASGVKQLHIVDGGGHTDLIEAGGEVYLSCVKSFISGL